ncbi:MAG: hypothetical protein N3E51_02015 [Candidatus Micrarchaeota archaeon]|nr:hypothetical protein [Candidatus Micrarchaeota archaeon]
MKKSEAAARCALRPACGLRGQAAMEYLMTYGWALLVIVIVIAILLIINPFSPPQGCRFDDAAFTCNNPVVSTNGGIFMQITNGKNNAINIYQIHCTSDKSPNPPKQTSFTLLKKLERQETYEVSPDGNNPLQCVDAYGVRLRPSAGSEFSGKVWVFYRNEEDGPSYPYRTVSANVVTKVVAATTASPGPS